MRAAPTADQKFSGRSTPFSEPLEHRLLFAGTGTGGVFTPLVEGDFNLDGTADEVVFARANRAKRILAEAGSARVGRGVFVVDGLSLAGLGLVSRLGPGAVTPLVATGDFNNDGATDLVVASRPRSQTLEVFLNDGSGGFTAGAPVSVPGPVTSLAVADFNDDDNDDLLVGTDARRQRNVRGTTGPRDTIGSDPAAAAQLMQNRLEMLTGRFLPSTTGAGVSAEAGGATGLPLGAFVGPGDIAPGVVWTQGATTTPMTFFFAVGSGQGAQFRDFVPMPGAAEEAGGAVARLGLSWDTVFPPDAIFGLAVGSGGTGGGVSVLLGNGDGTFQDATPVGGSADNPFIPVWTPLPPAP